VTCARGNSARRCSGGQGNEIFTGYGCKLGVVPEKQVVAPHAPIGPSVKAVLVALFVDACAQAGGALRKLGPGFTAFRELFTQRAETPLFCTGRRKQHYRDGQRQEEPDKHYFCDFFPNMALHGKPPDSSLVWILLGLCTLLPTLDQRKGHHHG